MLLILVCSLNAGALESLEMSLRWNYLKLGTATFIEERRENEHRFEIIGKTAGPLRLVKNYDGRGLLVSEGRIADYTLEGTDGGIDEIRRIVFEQGQLPMVLAFKDSGAITPLEPAEPWGQQAVSPMALVYRVIRSANLPQLCDGTHLVYDGKRRYQVQLLKLNALDTDSADTTPQEPFVCSAVLFGASLESAEGAGIASERVPANGAQRLDLDQEKTGALQQVWLFGRSDRRMDFKLQPGCSLNALREMLIFSSFGKIVGKASTEC